MEKFVVTIGREFGSSGKEIGRELAWQLGVECYDRSMVEKAAEEAGIPPEEVAMADETVSSGANRMFTASGISLGMIMQADTAIAAQNRVIRQLAEKSSCVIIGRCADYVLRDHENCFNIFIYAPYEVRLHRIMDLYGFSAKQAERSVKRIDRQRHNYYKYVTGSNRGDRHGKQLMIDSSMLGQQGTADLLYEIVCKRFDLEIKRR